MRSKQQADLYVHDACVRVACLIRHVCCMPGQA